MAVHENNNKKNKNKNKNKNKDKNKNKNNYTPFYISSLFASTKVYFFDL